MASEHAISLDEFSSDPEAVFDQVADKHESIAVKDRKGRTVILMPARPANRRYRRSRTRTRGDYEQFLSTAGSWADVDTDSLLKDIYESRSISTRPHVEL